MTLDAKTLYQETILSHGKNPQNEGPLASFTHEATAHNPLCGDRVTVRLVIENDQVSAIKFQARGCMIARASASLMTELVKNHDASHAHALTKKLHALVNAEANAEANANADLSELAPLEGVRAFPARKACVLLAWECLAKALAEKDSAPQGL